jgi:hypothetical protein
MKKTKNISIMPTVVRAMRHVANPDVQRIRGIVRKYISAGIL